MSAWVKKLQQWIPRSRPKQIALLIAFIVFGTELASWSILRIWPPNSSLSYEIEDPGPKPKGVVRVLFLGGSILESDHLGKAKFIRVIDRYLKKSASRDTIEILSWSHGDWNSTDLIQILHRSPHIEPDLIVWMSGHNEFIRDLTKPEEVGRKWLIYSKYPLATQRLFFHWIESFGFESTLEMPPEERRKIIYTKYQENLEILKSWAEDQKIRLLISTLPSNILDWRPVFSPDIDFQFMRNWLWNVKWIKEGNADAAEYYAFNEEKLDQWPAIKYYVQGQFWAAQRVYDRGYDLLEKARDEDPFPRRMTTPMLRAVRAVPQNQNLTLLDLEKTFREKAPGGLIGFDWIADHIHPSWEGSLLIADQLVQELSNRLPGLWPRYDEAHFAQVKKEVKFNSRDWFEHLIRVGQSAMQPPFLNYTVAEIFFRHAGENHSKGKRDAWRAWANLASAVLNLKRRSEGLEYLRLTDQLKGGPLTEEERNAIPGLNQAIEWTL